MDPQGHAGLGLNVDPDDYDRSMYDVLLQSNVEIDSIVLPILDNLDLAPSSVVLAAAEQELADKPGRERRLAAKLSRLRKEYDYVVIDCPPSIGLLTFNALAASRETIIPVDPSFFSLHGLHKVRETIELLRDELGHEVHIKILANNYNSRTNFSRDILYEIENFHGDSMLKTTISHTVKLKEAASRGQPIVKFESGNRAAKEFLALAEEVLAQEPFFQVAARRDYAGVFQGPQAVSGGVRFVLDAPQATDVRVTGSFTGWSYEGVPLDRGEDGSWSRVIEIPSGSYEYRFILDGVWVKDPNNLESTLNEFGQENSVVVV
jgi:chromosome partitioning protein